VTLLAIHLPHALFLHNRGRDAESIGVVCEAASVLERVWRPEPECWSRYDRQRTALSVSRGYRRCAETLLKIGGANEEAARFLARAKEIEEEG
jgi:uncharacterized membrane-anchored protein